MNSRYRIGIDVGGTFTDGIIVNEQTGETKITKVPSTPNDPSIGFLVAVERILNESKIKIEDLKILVHGTTVATNSIIEGKLANTGFITTEGFRDLLEIQRQIRPSLYDLLFEKPTPLVPRYLCFGVTERLDSTGNELIPLDRKSVVHAAEKLKKEGVEAIAICFLHSFLNPEHEQKCREIIKDVYPESVISISSDVAPEFREYFRASTTVINAGVKPVVERYLSKIESKLNKIGFKGESLIMQSNGGVLTFTAAKFKPVFMVESGPAAGVIASTHIGNKLGFNNIMSFDMGGTTAKTGLIEKGTPKITKEYEVGTVARAEYGAKGSGYPIRTPVIDLIEIGAGGGSIAWVDSGGVLRVGPKSAGADPAPACYGKGGIVPTITDANLVLNRFDQDYFLGGEMKLDKKAAYNAIKEKCSDQLGLDVVEVALGIVEIANSAMANALRRISLQRGYDPRDFILIAFGGAGPVHANRLIEELEIPKLLIPMSPGITSAMGLLVTDLKHDFSNTLIEKVDNLDLNKVSSIFSEMEEKGRYKLLKEGRDLACINFQRNVDMRYVGQSYELSVPLSKENTKDALKGMLKLFHKEHQKAYGFGAPDEPVEFVTLRLTAIGTIKKPKMLKISSYKDNVSKALRKIRKVYFAEENDFIDCPSYNRYKLGAGMLIKGPAVVEEIDSTTVIHPNYGGKVDDFGNILISASK